MEEHIPSDSLEIDRKERARLPSLDIAHRAVIDRVCDFSDICVPMSDEEAMFEASRCVHCPEPAPCVLACPAHNDIPTAMWLIEQGKFVEAAQIYRKTSSLPEICGRVCPHAVLCAGSCSHLKSHASVLTGDLEAFVTCFERRTVGVTIPKGEPTGKRVAVVGAGPAGLGCAEQLVQFGHQVTIFEARPAPGGLVVYGIPPFKMPKELVFCRVGDLEDAGVEIKFNIKVGKDITIDDLFAQGFEAVFIGVGSEVDAKMGIEGEDLPGVIRATEFLARCNVDLDLLPEEWRSRPEVGKRVVVIGGGDTATDCLRTAVRYHAEEVTCLCRRTIKEMPGGVKDRELALEEGADFHFLTQPVRFIAGEDGHLAQVECVRMELGEPDASGRRRPVEMKGSNFMVEANTAVLALGFWPDPIIRDTTPGLQTEKYGLIIADHDTGATSRPGVYAGGDGVTGPDLVVTAMVSGRKAARAIDQYLMKR